MFVATKILLCIIIALGLPVPLSHTHTLFLAVSSALVLTLRCTFPAVSLSLCYWIHTHTKWLQEVNVASTEWKITKQTMMRRSLPVRARIPKNVHSSIPFSDVKCLARIRRHRASHLILGEEKMRIKSKKNLYHHSSLIKFNSHLLFCFLSLSLSFSRSVQWLYLSNSRTSRRLLVHIIHKKRFLIS